MDEICSTDEITARKLDSALKTIGEVSEELNLPQHILRFWEKKFGQVEPVKRRGRRYYRPEDIDLLKQIQLLLYKEGYTVKGVQNYLLQYKKAEQPDLFNPEAPTQPDNNSPSPLPHHALEKVLGKMQLANAVLKKALVG